MPQVEIFTPTGVMSGSITGATVESDPRGTPAPVPLSDGRWYPLDGSTPERCGSVIVGSEEILLAAVPPPEVPGPGQWYPLELDLGPYHLEAGLPVQPGFDPARALARPGGAYVPLRDVSISLTGRPEAGVAERPYALVNRYAVDRIASDLMLGFFFPGAVQDPLPEPGTPLVVARAVPVA